MLRHEADDHGEQNGDDIGEAQTGKKDHDAGKVNLPGYHDSGEPEKGDQDTTIEEIAQPGGSQKD